MRVLQKFRPFRGRSLKLRDCLRPLCFRAILFIVSLLAPALTHAVTLFSTDDPTANTTEPGGELAGSGWQWVGSFGPFCATAIGPHHFLCVKHVGVPSSVIVLRGYAYNITQTFDDPGSELRILQVAETVADYAPLYSQTDEAGRGLVVIGRGTQRGNPIYQNGKLCGWEWGVGDQVQRWGENQVAEAEGYTLHATFDQNAGPNEAHLSSGDSGGAVFINDAGTWKLAGINSSVDSVATDSAGSAFTAMLFDSRGFYDFDGAIITGRSPIPTGFSAVRISSQRPWISSVISPGPQPPATPSPTPSATPSQSPLPSPTPNRPAGAAQMVTPVQGSTLDSSVQTFTWTSGSANSYWLNVGTSAGAANIYNSGKLSLRSLVVQNLPTDGSTVYVLLRTRVGKKWRDASYSYAAYGAAPSPSPPPPSAVLLMSRAFSPEPPATSEGISNQ